MIQKWSVCWLCSLMLLVFVRVHSEAGWEGRDGNVVNSMNQTLSSLEVSSAKMEAGRRGAHRQHRCTWVAQSPRCWSLVCSSCACLVLSSISKVCWWLTAGFYLVTYITNIRWKLLNMKNTICGTVIHAIGLCVCKCVCKSIPQLKAFQSPLWAALCESTMKGNQPWDVHWVHDTLLTIRGCRKIHSATTRNECSPRRVVWRLCCPQAAVRAWMFVCLQV